LILYDGEKIFYDKACICTGSFPLKPVISPIEKWKLHKDAGKNIFYFYGKANS
jgi:NAD(P)H-nitrite reductase large subunit